MSENVKINVTLNFDLPLEYDSNGRRKTPMELVTPLLEDYIWDLQYNLDKHGGKLGSTLEFPYAEYTSICDKFVGMDAVSQERIDNNLRESYSAKDGIPYNKWLDGKEEECQELYGMSSREFFRLTWKDRDIVRLEKGITWDETSNKWSKNEKV